MSPAVAVRASHRVHAKGSARGAGPQQVRSVVYVLSSQVVQCVWCGKWWHGHGVPSPHAATIVREAPRGWPECEHGTRFLEDCVGHPVVPHCCGGGWAPSVQPLLNARVQSGGPLFASYVAAQAVAEGLTP